MEIYFEYPAYIFLKKKKLRLIVRILTTCLPHLADDVLTANVVITRQGGVAECVTPTKSRPNIGV